ncbi:MAG: hypothetical protein WC933_03540 [Candidatus Paceibacterota bacterium]|jgi:hypothetical protein
MDLLQLQKNFATINAWEILQPIIVKNLKRVEELNRKQLLKGDMSDGTSRHHSKSEMSEIYIEDKISRGVYDQSIYPAMNFYNEGDFHKGIKAQMDLFGIEIESLDSKAKELEQEYGSVLYGLTDDSLKELLEPIIPEYIQSLFLELSKG